ncbi:hypothetical protein NQG63_10625 [Exiguobacterium himgiriensis]|uniref:hypothetical protein n=1 Tax=Exiguobacterium sp. s122 TaxID=2751220 RepID=UPI001BEB2DF7|nr:hypothetical protein [Exiguobacterium sp. s122]MCT4783710.1 hypothetical protein [Exiguobacterium himgiriensis]
MEWSNLSARARFGVKAMYANGHGPDFFCSSPQHHVYVALEGQTPIAALATERLDEGTDRVIRLRHEAYRNRHVFHGLMNRLLHKLSRESVQETMVLLQVVHDEDQDKLNLFTSLGFDPYHTSFNYVLPLVPYEKATFDHWKLSVVDPSNYATWLHHRNEHALVLPDVFPLTEERLRRFLARNHCCYTLHRKGKAVGIFRAHYHQDCVMIHEIHLFEQEEVTQEAIPFLQRTFCHQLKPSRRLRLTVTSLQPDLQYAIIKQEAVAKQSAFYTMTNILPARAARFN